MWHGFWNLKAHPNDTTTSTRPHLLSFSNRSTNGGTKHPNMWVCGGILLQCGFLQRGILHSPQCVITVRASECYWSTKKVALQSRGKSREGWSCLPKLQGGAGIRAVINGRRASNSCCLCALKCHTCIDRNRRNAIFEAGLNKNGSTLRWKRSLKIKKFNFGVIRLYDEWEFGVRIRPSLRGPLKRHLHSFNWPEGFPIR